MDHDAQEKDDEEAIKKATDKKAEMNSVCCKTIKIKKTPPINLINSLKTVSHAKYKPAPVVKMISKHRNGTLNLWSVTFADKSKFSSLLNINHKARASGHRYFSI